MFRVPQSVLVEERAPDERLEETKFLARRPRPRNDLGNKGPEADLPGIERFRRQKRTRCHHTDLPGSNLKQIVGHEISVRTERQELPDTRAIKIVISIKD